MERGMGKCRAVIATDADGNETYYPTMTLAAESVGADRKSISAACDSGYRCRGLYWRKAEPDDRPLTKMQAAVVLAFAHNAMRYKPTCEVLYLHENSVRYNLDKAHERTGKNPRDFFELYELVQIAKEVLNEN